MSDLSPQEKRRIKRKIHDHTYYNHVIKRVNCTLTNEEYRELCRFAKTTGFKPTVYFRKASLAYMRQRYVVPVQAEDKLQKLIIIMRNIGRNINVLATRANKFLKVRELDFRKLETLVFHLEDQVKMFIRNPKKEDADILDESERREL